MQHLNKDQLIKIVLGRWGRVAFGAVLGITLLVQSFHKIDWSVFWKSFQNVKVGFLIISLFFTLIYLLFKSWRWKILLDQKSNLQFDTVWRLSVIGLTLGIVLPYLGEISKVLMVGKEVKRRFVVVTVLMEKILDLIFLCLIIFAAGFIFPLPYWVSGSLRLAFLALIIFGLVVILSRRGGKLLPSFISQALREVSNKNALVTSFAITILSWTALTIVYWTSAISIGIEIPAISFLLVLSILYIGLTIPTSPGYVGSYQFLIWFGLSLFGVNKELSLAYSFLVFLVISLPTAVLGCYYLLRR